MEIIDEPTLFNEIDDREKKGMNGKLGFEDLYPFVNTALRMQEELSKHEDEISEELNHVSSGKISKLDEIDAGRYAERFNNALNSIDHSHLWKLWSPCYKYSKRHLIGYEKEKQTITQEDGWGDHVTKVSGLDANSFKKGSWIQQISCLIMHPKVFNKIEHQEETVRKIGDYCIRYTERKTTLNEITKDLYAGGLYSNIRLSAFRKENFNIGMRKALLVQSKTFFNSGEPYRDIQDKILQILRSKS
jgi:hypothetical protein